MRNIPVTIITIFLLTLGLAACAPAGQPADPIGNAALLGTSAANTGMVAQTTIDAATRSAVATRGIATRQAQATRDVATQQAVSAASTVTAAVEQVNIERMRLEMVQDLELTRTFSQATVAAIATDQAAALKVTELQMTRAALENQQRANEVAQQRAMLSFYQALPWVLLAFAIVLTLIVLGGYFYWRIRQDSPTKTKTPDGRFIFMIPTPQGRRPIDMAAITGPVVDSKPLALPDLQQGAGRPLSDEPRQKTGPLLIDGAQQQNEPAVVYLPSDIPPGYIALGASRQPLVYSPSQLKSMMVAGEKGSGKSSFLQLVAYQAVRQKWEVFFIDPEQLTFDPDVWGQVAESEKDVESLLKFLVYDLFNYRLSLYREASNLMRQAYRDGRIQEPFRVEKLSDYNKAAAIFGLTKLAPFMLLWDEATSHFGNKKIQELLHEYIRRSRKPGGVSLLASQSWYSSGPNGLSGVIKQRLERRVCFRTDDKTSQIVLGPGNTAGALIPPTMPGHAIVRRDADGRLGRMQAYLVPDRLLFEYITPEATANRQHHVWTKHVPPPISNLPIPGQGGQSTIVTGVFEEMPSQIQNQAEKDAQWLQTKPAGAFGSRRQICLALTNGLDNEYAYTRADAALGVLSSCNDPDWARKAHELLAKGASVPA